MFPITRTAPPIKHPLYIYPLNRLEVGEGYFVATADAKDRHRVRAAASNYRRRNPGWGYAARQCEQDGIAGVWIERTT